MSRGRGFSSSRGFRGSSNRGSSWSSSSRGSYGPSRGGGPGNSGSRFSSSFSPSYDSRSKYQSSDRYGSGSRNDDFRKSYRPDSGSGYSPRDHRSPDRKRMRTLDSLSSRHDSGFGDGFSRYESPSYQERRSFSDDRRPPSFSRRSDEFRKPPPPPSMSPRGGYRGRISSRGPLRSRLRDRPMRRRLMDSSYMVRRRPPMRSIDYARRLKISRLRSSVVRHPKKSGSENELSEKKDDNDNKDKTDKDDEVEAGEGEEGKEISIKEEKEEKKVESEEDDRHKGFIKLLCPHCGTKCLTFKRYSFHLQSNRHYKSMRSVAMKQRSILSRMRAAQRNAQREVEKDDVELTNRSQFCPLCKLNYRQPKSVHQASEAHKSMKKFLMPYCKICRITCKSPMQYESHLCSIDHIKRKAYEDKSDKEEGSGIEDNLDNFMTIDSVGDMDDDAEKKDVEIKEEKPEMKVNIGVESIRKIEVYYCDLCRMYLPRGDNLDVQKILTSHCRQRTHMKRYVRHKEDEKLAKRAEKLQRKETAERKEKVKDIKAEDGIDKKDEGDPKENGDTTLEDEDAGEEKMWADVDKDLGDILAEAGGNKSSDEDEEMTGSERYDRFKLSEKNAEEKKKGAAATSEINVKEEELKKDVKLEEK